MRPRAGLSRRRRPRSRLARPASAPGTTGTAGCATARWPRTCCCAAVPSGERLLPEVELGWLPGHDGGRPVRIGNAAAAQPPLAAFGEVQMARLRARMAGLPDFSASWSGDRLLSVLESAWRQPDCGIWESRSAPRQFVHSKVM